MNQLPIVIFCHKNDYFLTKICVASIRYHYPDVDIYLVKDKINGNFSSKNLEKYFQVKKLSLQKKIFGWGVGKIFLLVNPKLPFKKCLFLDSDTIFTGKVLDKLSNLLPKAEFIVSPEYDKKPGEITFEKVYYPIKWVIKTFPKFKYPGYTFNSGCFVGSLGQVKKKDLSVFLNFCKFPYWKKNCRQNFPCVDQSLLNVILPMYSNRTKVKLIPFILWSESEEIKKIKLAEIEKNKFSFIIHWAGSKKNKHVNYMTRGDILSFFEKYYYSQLPFGFFKYYWHYFFTLSFFAVLTDYFVYHYQKGKLYFFQNFIHGFSKNS